MTSWGLFLRKASQGLERAFTISDKERIQHLYIGHEGIQPTDLVAIKVTHCRKVLIQNPPVSLAGIVQMQSNIAEI